MKFVFFIFLLFPLSSFAQDDRFSLYLINRNKESGFAVDNSLNLTDQIYFLQKTDSTLKLYNNALTIECFGDTSAVYYCNELVGNYQTKLWKDPHYYIIEFVQTKSFYYFYEIFPFMDR